MDSPEKKQRLSGMIPVVRLYSVEEGEEFSRMASSIGVLAVVVDLTKGSGPFDGSLGGFTAAAGYALYAAPEHVPALCRALEETLTVDPDDPLCSLSNEELRAILKRPLRSNLTEWALARKLLLMRGDTEDRERTRRKKPIGPSTPMLPLMCGWRAGSVRRSSSPSFQVWYWCCLVSRGTVFGPTPCLKRQAMTEARV